MLVFDEDKHQYFLGDEELPCVSEILRFMFREAYPDTDKKAMDKAAGKGTRIHKACEEIDRTGTTECDRDTVEYVNGYVKFLKDHDVSWSLIEKSVYQEDTKYAGTLDRYGVVDGKRTLLDIKSTKSITGKHKLLYATQLAAYGACLKDEDIEQFCILQLKPDGTYRLIKVEPNIAVWVSCLILHNEFNKTKRKRVSK